MSKKTIAVLVVGGIFALFMLYFRAVAATNATNVYLPLLIRAETTSTPTTPPANVKITHIEYDPPGTDLDGEYVTIQNQGGSAAVMTGWTLADNDSHVFTFPSFTLQPNASVNVWSKAGSNTSTDLFWGSSQAIWTNTGDCATLHNGISTIHQVCY
jgi:hypothetical protein